MDYYYGNPDMGFEEDYWNRIHEDLHKRLAYTLEAEEERKRYHDPVRDLRETENNVSLEEIRDSFLNVQQAMMTAVNLLFHNERRLLRDPEKIVRVARLLGLDPILAARDPLHFISSEIQKRAFEAADKIPEIIKIIDEAK